MMYMAKKDSGKPKDDYPSNHIYFYLFIRLWNERTNQTDLSQEQSLFCNFLRTSSH